MQPAPNFPTTLPSLRLDEETHTYWLGERQLPGISELLKFWGFIDSTYYTEDGREVGRAVHAGIHDIESGGAASNEFQNEAILHRLDEYVRFKEDKDFRVTWAEKIFCDLPGRYACKIDLYGHFGESTAMALIEVKCGAVQGWHRLQTAAQMRAIMSHSSDLFRRFALYLPKTGRYNLKEHTDRSEISVVEGLANAYWWKQNCASK